MEEIRTAKTQWNFEKDSDYNHDADNYAIPYELTVTITLNEYRNLIKGDMVNKIDNLRLEKWKLEDEIKQLKEKLKNVEELIPAVETVQINK